MEQQKSSNESSFQGFINFLKDLQIPTLMDEPQFVEANEAPRVDGEVEEPAPVVPTEEAAPTAVQTFNDKKRILSIKKSQREAKQNLRSRQKSSQMAGLNPLGIKSGLNIPMV
jgi:hypothetical protein